MADARGSVIESVDRALRLLQILGHYGTGATLEELAAETGLPKSSLHRTLAALRQRGFAATQGDGRYLLGAELLRVAFDFHERLDLRAVLHPLLERLREQLNETVHLGVLDGPDVVYLDKLESSHPIRLTSMVGGRNPAHATAVGKALLAWTYPNDDAFRAWVSRHGALRRRTPNTITDVHQLVREMARIRGEGYARDMEESELGVRCVAVPVFLGRTTPDAAISVSAPRDRLRAARIREVGRALLVTAPPPSIEPVDA
jgi:IclR family acetate operon transcriptional repressor